MNLWIPFMYKANKAKQINYPGQCNGQLNSSNKYDTH